MVWHMWILYTHFRMLQALKMGPQNQSITQAAGASGQRLEQWPSASSVVPSRRLRATALDALWPRLPLPALRRSNMTYLLSSHPKIFQVSSLDELRAPPKKIFRNYVL